MTIENELYSVVEKAKKYDKLLKFQNSFEALRCSFCMKDQNNVKKLIAGSNVYICNECVEICNEILKDEVKE